MLSRCPWQTETVVDDRFERLAQARLYLVCDEMPVARLDAALRGGVQLVQLRMKAAGASRIVAVARRFATICERHRVPLIINDHPELVEAAGADGVHLGQDDLPIAEAREQLGTERIIGLSTHDADQIRAAGPAGADYIGVGPIHATPTKPGRPAVGTDLIAQARAEVVQPFFAIGGIHAGNLAAVLAAGAERVAVVRAIGEAEDPERAAAALRAALDSGVRVGAA
jgi:thiamine-phosphate pyrophosphorylase